MTTTDVAPPARNAAGVRWDLTPLCADAAEARRQLEAGLERAREFEARYRGRLAEIGPAELAEALAELAAIENQLSRAASYASLREATDVTDEENRDLAAAVDRAMVEAGNHLRFFELEWIALPEERATALADAPEVARDRHHLISARRFAPHTLSEPEERMLAERAPGRGERVADHVRPDDLDARGPVRRRRGRGAAHHRPAAGPRARSERRRPPARARHAVRRARAPDAGAGPLLRHAGGRPPGDGPPAPLLEPHGAHPPAQRAAGPGGRAHAGRGRAALPPGPALVPGQGRDPRARAAPPGRPVRADRRGPRRRLRRGAGPHRRLLPAVLRAGGRPGRRLLRRAAHRRRAPGGQARRRLLLAGGPGRAALRAHELHRPHERRDDPGPRARPRHALQPRRGRADRALLPHRAGAGRGPLDLRRDAGLRPPHERGEAIRRPGGR